MSSMLTSQGLILATAMAVSAGTVILFDLFRDKYFHQNQDPLPDNNRVLKSYLSSSGFKKQGREQRKKKRVQFADDVKDSKKNGELYRRKQRSSAQIQRISCGKENLASHKMPANRMALYSGILKDRVHRVEYSC